MPNNLTDAEENRLLDLSLVDGDLLALMSTPGTDSTIGTEVTGGSYARQVMDWANASGGSKANAAAVNFPSMPAVDVKGWLVLDSTGASRKWYGLFAAKSATAQAAADTITYTAHGYTDGKKVVFQDGYTPAGLTAGTTYYVRDSTANTFKVSATLGGAAINITADSTLAVVGEVLEVVAGAAVNLPIGSISLSLS